MIYSRGLQRNLFCIFSSLIQFSMNFSSLYEFQELKLKKGNWKKKGTVTGQILAQGLTAWPSPVAEAAQSAGVAMLA
jgi:hypothetical protein